MNATSLQQTDKPSRAEWNGVMVDTSVTTEMKIPLYLLTHLYVFTLKHQNKNFSSGIAGLFVCAWLGKGSYVQLFTMHYGIQWCDIIRLNDGYVAIMWKITP